MDPVDQSSKALRLYLSPYLNNKAFGTRPGEASFDTTNRSFPALDSLATGGIYTSPRTGVQYGFNGYAGSDGQLDNVVDIGPRADGTIVQAEADNLRAAGIWIKKHAEAIFGTTHWFVQTQITSPAIRFTQTEDASHILFMEKPQPVDGDVLVDAPVPILERDVVTIVGPGDVESLIWKRPDGGGIAIQASPELLALDGYCWVFKIEYQS